MEVRYISSGEQYASPALCTKKLDILGAYRYLCGAVLMAGGKIDMSARPHVREEDLGSNPNQMTHVIAFTRRSIFRPHGRFSIYAFFGTAQECWGLECFAYSYEKHKRWVDIYLGLLSRELQVDVLERGNMWRVTELQEQRFRLHMMFFLNRNKDCRQVIEALKLGDEDFARCMLRAS